ncbi:MAG TPA: YihY/virulence factor BrkB family protein [Blastocatellia bacterium]|nr:YihY/virulence factor BrkB family protein [Blastocatellia bacterium]
MNGASYDAHPDVGGLIRRVWRESLEDRVLGRAAELSYYFLLALFPLLIVLTSVIGFFPGAREGLLSAVVRVAPQDAMKLVQGFLDDIVNHRSGGVLSLGLILSLWSASSGVASLMDALNAAYDARETRPFWKHRLIAIGLTVAMALLVMGGALLIIIGHRVGPWLERALQTSPLGALGLTVLGYVIGFLLLLAGIAMLYYFGPNIKRGTRPIKAGALFASIGTVFGSLLFSFYLRLVPGASATYGSLGAVVTLMIWLYLMGLMLLVGGEINSEMSGDA